jgi:dTDP-3,4-didehydro-2,6-dideoxy-alpha-D-glucose 3-reductase
MRVINIAVWSSGNHVIRNILPAIEKSNSLNLVGILTRNQKTLLSQSNQYACLAYANEDELLADTKIDAIYIGSPNALHYEHVIKCLLNKKHVIVEKSAVANLKEAQSIYKLAQEFNLLVMEGFMFTFHKQFIELKKLIKSKKYGEVLFVEADFGYPHLKKDDIRYSKRLAGGALNDAGAYTISAILNLLGKESELIFSSINNHSNYEVDTSGIAILRNKDIKAICKWSMGVSYKNEIKIWCEDGIILTEKAFSKLDIHNSLIKISKNGELRESIDSGQDNHFVKMFDSFTRNINNELFSKEWNKLLMQSSILDKIRTFSK